MNCCDPKTELHLREAQLLRPPCHDPSPTAVERPLLLA